MKWLYLTLLISTSTYSFMKESDYIGTVDYKIKWSSIFKEEEKNLRYLLDILKGSKTGQALIERAEIKASKQGSELLTFIKEGRGSLTDTTLTRKFTEDNPDHVSYESQSVIYINKDLSVMDAVLDLAHELGHFVYRTAFNPYTLNFTLKEFIKNTIEGEGGEAHAFLNECQVLKELFSSAIQKRSNCHKIFDPQENEYSKTLAIKHFYRVGDNYEAFDEILKDKSIRQDFKDLSSERVTFVSSAYGGSYPVAAYKEYQNILYKVCENDQKRLALMRAKKGRSIASQEAYDSFVESYEKRCSR